MNNNQKMWGLLVHLSNSEWRIKYDRLNFDDEVWEYIEDNPRRWMNRGENHEKNKTVP